MSPRNVFYNVIGRILLVPMLMLYIATILVGFSIAAFRKIFGL